MEPSIPAGNLQKPNMGFNTIADLDHAADIQIEHLVEAINY
jgi:hypothetical protein